MLKHDYNLIAEPHLLQSTKPPDPWSLRRRKNRRRFPEEEKRGGRQRKRKRTAWVRRKEMGRRQFSEEEGGGCKGFKVDGVEAEDREKHNYLGRKRFRANSIKLPAAGIKNK